MHIVSGHEVRCSIQVKGGGKGNGKGHNGPPGAAAAAAAPMRHRDGDGHRDAGVGGVADAPVGPGGPAGVPRGSMRPVFACIVVRKRMPSKSACVSK